MSIVLQEPALVEEVNMLAEREGRVAADIVAEAVRRLLAEYRQRRIAAETEAWYRLTAAERQSYAGKFVAVYGGKVVDSDPDRLKLYLRLRERYGRRPILITAGGDYPIPTYRVRSPWAGGGNAHEL